MIICLNKQVGTEQRNDTKIVPIFHLFYTYRLNIKPMGRITRMAIKTFEVVLHWKQILWSASATQSFFCKSIIFLEKGVIAS